MRRFPSPEHVMAESGPSSKALLIGVIVVLLLSVGSVTLCIFGGLGAALWGSAEVIDAVEDEKHFDGECEAATSANQCQACCEKLNQPRSTYDPTASEPIRRCGCMGPTLGEEPPG